MKTRVISKYKKRTLNVFLDAPPNAQPARQPAAHPRLGSFTIVRVARCSWYFLNDKTCAAAAKSTKEMCAMTCECARDPVSDMNVFDFDGNGILFTALSLARNGRVFDHGGPQKIMLSCDPVRQGRSCCLVDAVVKHY